MKPPRFWDGDIDPRAREAAPFLRALLTPVAALYSWGVRRKITHATPPSVPIPVICIGNLTVGGVGKTPIVAALRQHFADQGIRTASLSRGYGGREAGPLKINPAIHTAALVGDEPLMLSVTGESWIGQDRGAAAAAMAADGVDLILMDDGYQNTTLNKDVNIVVIDSVAGFGNGFVIPKGPLREPIAFGLSRADAIIIVGSGPFALNTTLPTIRARFAPIAPPPNGALVAFAGIGRPIKFFDGLKAAGATLTEEVPYPDHHVYSAKDLSYLRSLAKTHGAQLITTEKDASRLPEDQRTGIATFPIRAEFDSIAPLDALIRHAIETHRGK